MNRRSYGPLLVLILVLGGMGAGCDSETGVLLENQLPNTRISAGPPERTDTSYNVNLFWFGWDEDGFIDHYEIAWEDTTNWISPIFTNDSLFVVEASESCCVEPLPDYGTILRDSVYEQFHTFYVRAVDDAGVPDPTPAFRSFNAKTIAPACTLSFGPRNNQIWGTNVEFEWTAGDDDGFVVAYRFALSSTIEFVNDIGRPPDTGAEFVAWLDTLQFRPLPGGGYSDEEVWQFTEEDSIVFPALPPTGGTGVSYIFAVRAIDNAGAEERILNRGVNTRTFGVTDNLDGPRLTVVSNNAGTWRTGDPAGIREVFGKDGLRFQWSAIPGPSGAEVAGFRYSVGDSLNWSAFSENSVEWPERLDDGTEVFWFPETGFHSFFLQAIDQSGFIRTQIMRLQVFPGPQDTPAPERFILIVLDTAPEGLTENGFWPLGYQELERGMIDMLFEDYDFEIFETRGGTRELLVSRMNDASSIFWFHSTLTAASGSLLQTYHAEPSVPNVLPSFVASGGNLFIAGLQLLNALRYIETIDSPEPQFQLNLPVNFQNSATDTTLIPHWAFTQMGIQVIEGTVGATLGPDDPRGLRLAASRIRDGANPYPDLAFDELTWPEGPRAQGFGFYDRGIITLEPSEPIYDFNGEDSPIAIRKLTQPGVNGNIVFCSFHPYFVEKTPYRDFIRAVMADFGESPSTNP